MVGLFHHSDSTYIGPVRSVRPTDAVLESLGATVGISGAQPWIADMVAAEGVSIIREGEVGPPSLFRISGRVPPYNLYANSLELRLEADRRGYPNEPPPVLFKFGPFQYGGSPSATTINVSVQTRLSTRLGLGLCQYGDRWCHPSFRRTKRVTAPHLGRHARRVLASTTVGAPPGSTFNRARHGPYRVGPRWGHQRQGLGRHLVAPEPLDLFTFTIN